jgi:hypothetical protein
MSFLDPHHPFFKTPLRRWLTAILPAAWGIVEIATVDPFWGVIFLASGIYAYWVLIATYNPPNDGD